MPYREIFFEKYQPVHIVSRAVEEREIFKVIEDCYRFIFQIYAANVGKPARNLRVEDVIKTAKAILEGEKISPRFITTEHPPFVSILDFSLVINHYHFYFFPNAENIIPLFMKKLNGGFAKYLNLKYSRKGALIGGRYKSILIKSQFQGDAVSRYVSIINPLDVYQPNWRKDGLKNEKEALRFLEEYPFSSFPDKIGKRKSKILAPKEILKRYSFISSSQNKEVYLNFIKEFLKQSSLPFFLE